MRKNLTAKQSGVALIELVMVLMLSSLIAVFSFGAVVTMLTHWQSGNNLLEIIDSSGGSSLLGEVMARAAASTIEIDSEKAVFELVDDAMTVAPQSPVAIEVICDSGQLAIKVNRVIAYAQGSVSQCKIDLKEMHGERYWFSATYTVGEDRGVPYRIEVARAIY